MVLIDTNVLVYAANADATKHRACRDWVEARRRDPSAWFLTWGIVYELLRVLTHPRVLAHPMSGLDASAFVSSLLPSPGLEILVETERHADVLSLLVAEMPNLSGNLWHDAHTATLMREHGIRRIATFDTDFHRFTFLEPFDPVP